MSCLTNLPDEVLKLLMQCLTLKERLGCCCLVSKRLYAAAVAATDYLELPKQTIFRAEPALDWVLQHGQQLTRLYLSNFRQPLQQLPCRNLRELKLSWCSVQLGPAAGGQPGVIQGCTKLTLLYLGCDIIDASEGVVLDGSLSSLVDLQHLVVQPTRGSLTLSVQTLPHLQHLTYLDVDSLSVENLLQLGGLTNLQELYHMADAGMAIGPNTVRGLVFPASLTKLVLRSEVEGNMLSLVPGLHELQVECDVEGPAEGPDSFSTSMARLHHLTCLELSDIVMDWPPPGHAYSALTASSRLVHLGMIVTQFPQGIWPFVFPIARKLPHLTHLALRALDPDEEDSFAEAPRWDAADLSSLVSCCPSLCAIHTLSLQIGVRVLELHKLAALTRLDVWCRSDNFAVIEECVRDMAAVTRLRSMRIVAEFPNTAVFGVDGQLTVASLLPLTSLTALTCLECCWYTAEEQHRGSVARISTQAGSASDVWLQLLERCAANPVCQPIAMRSLAQQLGEQKALTTSQQQQLANQQQQNAAQQQQVGGLLVQVSGQQQTIAVQQQQIGDMQQRLLVQEQLITHQQQQGVAVKAQLLAQQQITAQQGAQIAVMQEQLQALLQRGEAGGIGHPCG